MSEGRETALRAALQILGDREIDAPDLLAVAEWLRSGRHPYDDKPDVQVEKSAPVPGPRLRFDFEDPDPGDHDPPEEDWRRLHDLQRQFDQLAEQRDKERQRADTAENREHALARALRELKRNVAAGLARDDVRRTLPRDALDELLRAIGATHIEIAPTGDHDPPEDPVLTARGIIASEREARLRAQRERDELLTAARAVLAELHEITDATAALAVVVERIDRKG